MNIIGKIAIGAAVTVVGGVIAKKVLKKKQYSKIKTPNQMASEIEKDIGKAEARMKVVEKVTDFVEDHPREIEAAEKLAKLAGAVLAMVVSIRKLKNGSDMVKKVNDIWKWAKDIDKESLETFYKSGFNEATYQIATMLNLAATTVDEDGLPRRVCLMDPVGKVYAKYLVKAVEA